MTDKETILNLKHGEKWIVPESDYGRAEIWFINDTYILFEMPTFGGNPCFFGCYSRFNIDKMIDEYNSWT